MSLTKPIPLVNPEMAPEQAKQLLATAKQELGMVPNLYRAMAHAPALLEGYRTIYELFNSKTSFNPVECQVVLLAVSYANECEYCVAGHSMVAELVKTDPKVVEALRAGVSVPDDKLAALTEFTRAVVKGRGWVDDAQLDAFYAAGYSQVQVFEVILGVALKTMSNYTNHMTDTPLDGMLASKAWKRGGGT